MKRKVLFLILCVFSIFITSVKAVSIMVDPATVEPQTYIIGTYLFNREKNAIYDGRLTTPRIMIAAHSINSEEEIDQIIYYKMLNGTWISALTGEEITLPEGKMEITKINLLDPEVESESTRFVDGQTFGQKIRALAGSTEEKNTNINAIVRSNELAEITYTDDNVLSLSTESTPIYGWFEEGTLYYYSEAEVFYLNEDSSYMFANLEGLEMVDFSPIYLHEVVNMEGMFKNCKSLNNLSFYDENTVNVTNMSYMFAGCSDLESLSLGGFAADKLLTMAHIFDGCSSLTDIYIDMDTSNVVDMSYAFNGCSNLKTLDLSNLDLSKADVTGLLSGTNSLTTLTTPKVNSNQTIALSRELYDEQLNKYESLDETTPTEEKLVAIATLLPGTEFNAKIKSVAANNNVSYTSTNTNINSITRAYEVPEEITLSSDKLISTVDSSNPVYIWFIDNSLYYYSEAIILYLSDDASYMFYRFSNVDYIDLSEINTSNVTNMSFMFRDCEKATSIDVSNFDTASVTNMNGMFYNCNSLQYLNVGNFQTENVTNMASMFAYCVNLDNLYVSNFDTSNVTNMQSMFYNCGKLSEIDISTFDTTKVTNMDNMFAGCASISSLDISNFNLSTLTSANYMFENMSSLNELYTPGTNSSKRISLIAVMKDENDNVYGSLTSSTPTSTKLTALTTVASGQKFNEKIKVLAGNEDATFNTIDNNITAIVRADSLPAGMTFTDDNIISAANSPTLIYAWYESGTIYYYSEENNIYLSGNSNYMFANLNSLTSVDLSEFNLIAVDIANDMLTKTPALSEIKTPKVNAKISIELPKTFYLTGNSNGINSLTESISTNTVLKSTVW